MVISTTGTPPAGLGRCDPPAPITGHRSRFCAGD